MPAIEQKFAASNGLKGACTVPPSVFIRGQKVAQFPKRCVLFGILDN
jgi:hypothetical protein